MKIIGNYILCRADDDGYILVPERGEAGDRETLCSLNSTGAFVWQELERRKNIREISKLCAKKYCIDRNSAENDITSFIHHLADIGIIEL